MKIALHNPFFGQNVAERELAQRICQAAANLGWQAVEVPSSSEIKSFAPDCVLALHFRVPKLTQYPTYGCMWNPPSFFEQEDDFIKNILSYDGYLCASDEIKLWLEDTLYNTAKKFKIIPFYPSCLETIYEKPNLENPHLIYVGSNWDGSRFKDLFLSLDKQICTKIYGNKDGWKYLEKSYQGEIDFDGVSLLKILNRGGVCLCLHKEEHSQSATPSMRIFEIAASGAVAICSEHQFIKDNFGDAVLYFSPDADVNKQVRQINEHFTWIKKNPDKAQQMSRDAHKIFKEKFNLEKSLIQLQEYHQNLIYQKGFKVYSSPGKQQFNLEQKVQLIIRVGNRSVASIKRAIDSIYNQTYPKTGIIIVKFKEVEGLDALLKKYEQKIEIKTLSLFSNTCRSSSLWAGINTVSSEYFGILDDDDIIYPNHIYTLISLLEEYRDCGVAYSGAIRVWEKDKSDRKLSTTILTNIHQYFFKEDAEVAYFQPFKTMEFMVFRNFITSNSFIARTSLLNNKIRKDPKLDVLEDFFLLLNLLTITEFIFSYEVTCEFLQRISLKDNASFLDKQKWDEVTQRIKRIMWNQEFVHRQYLGNYLMSMESHQSQFANAEVQRLKSRITAMESSKFWKLRQLWFKLKHRLGLPTID